MKAAAILTRILGVQPSQYDEMTEGDVMYWLRVAEEGAKIAKW